jgi:hypothetical protein
MNSEQFLQMLEQEGFPEPVEVHQPANSHLDEHRHPFEVKALVMSGQIELLVDGQKRHFQVGEVFHLEHDKPYCETYGPQGVCYLASRKYSSEVSYINIQ